jgi:hypothetical protein
MRAAAIVLILHAPLAVITGAVQALIGLLLPARRCSCSRATTFPHLNAARLAVWLSAALAACLAGSAVALRAGRRRRAAPAPPRASLEQRSSWRMPPLALLKPVTWSPAFRLGIIALPGYLVISARLLIKAIKLGAG